MAGRENELLERLKAGIVVLDSAGVIVHWNADAERILSLTANEAVGRPWTEVMAVVSGVDITGREVRATALLPGGWHGLAQLQVKNCPPLWVRAHIQETTLTPGERPGVAAVFWEAGSNANEPNPPAEIRDISHHDRLAKLLRDLGMVTGRSRADGIVEQATRDALDVIASAWRVDATIAVLDRDDGRLTISGSVTPEAIRAVIGNVETPRLHLGPADNDAGDPIEVVFAKQANLPVWAEAIKSLGVAVVRTAPLWLGDNSTGTLILMWNGTPEVRFDGTAMAQVGQHLGLVVGNAALRQMMRREAALRISLEDSARVGGVVVAQISDAILTLNIDESITAINPAGERQYGVTAEEILGRTVGEVIEQLGLDGERLGTDATQEARSSGFWHGRVIHRPLIGTRAGLHLLVDISLTTIHDSRHRQTGMIAMSHEVAASDQLHDEAAALGSLAVATSRGRNRHEVAEAALERLSEATMADAGIIVSWTGDGNVIEASRGLSEETVSAVRTSWVPALTPALDRPGVILPVEGLAKILAGTDIEAPYLHEGLVTGVLVDLRVRDESIGMMALAARRPAWGRPSDEVLLQAAAQVANAMSGAQLTERLEEGLGQERQLTAQLETLMGLTLLPGSAIAESGLARFLLEKVVAALGAGGGCAVRVADGRLRVVASFQMAQEMLQAIEDRPADTFHFWQRVVDSQDGRAFQESIRDLQGTDYDGMLRSGITSYAVFPVRESDKTLGAFMCYFTGANDTMAQTDARTIGAVGRTISIAYANARMSEGLAEAAERERRLTAQLQALQELTLLGAQTDDLGKLAQETIEAVVLATCAAGGGYILLDPTTSKVDPITWVGRPSSTWAGMSESPAIPTDWPPFDRLLSDEGVWLSQPDATDGSTSDTDGVAQAVLPLRVADRLAGVLNLEWHGSARAEQFDVHFLEPIARICSISLANFRLRSELVHRAAAQRALGHRLDTLDELTRIGEQASSFEELAHRTVSLVREALGACGVSYLLIEPGHHFETHAVAGETGAFRLWLKGVPAKDAPGGSLLLSGGNSILADFVADQVNERVLPLARATGFHSFAAIPIRTGEELAGTLLCFFDQIAASLPLDESALDSVARIAGIALANFRLRERLVSSEERYRTLFEESPDALLVSALDGTVLDANEAAVRLYRVNRGEVLGRYFGQMISADEREMARRRQIVWAQGRGTFKDRGRRADGSEFPLEVEVRVVELGGQRRFLHLVRDLSDQDRLTRELLQAQKMEAIGQLVSGVAHELNNPLAAIIAFSQLIRSDERLPEDMKHDAGLLVQEADRTRRIVQNLLDFARARPPERCRTSIRTLVQSVLELQSYALNASQIQVDIAIPETLPEVDLDRAQLQQVLLNLTINAIQAMRTRDRKKPAHLWVSASLVKTRFALPGVVRIERQEDDRRVRITIRDDGPGVPESARGRLFDPFFTTKQPGEGTGLGLSVSFGIIAAHDGHLWYEPGPGGVGSSFVLELPVSARLTDNRTPGGGLTGEVGSVVTSQQAEPSSVVVAATADPADAKSSDHSAQGVGLAPEGTSSSAAPVPPAAPLAPGAEVRRPRILVLDDEPSIRAFLRKALMAAGMDVLPYEDGAAAWEGIRSIGNFDVMLIDHRMAGMSGTEFYEAAVELRPEVAPLAIFMSGDVLNPDLSGFATQRGIRLLAKPFDIEAVIRIVREVLAANAVPSVE